MKNLIILAYHRVLPNSEALKKGTLAVIDNEFEQQISYFLEKGYKSITLKEYSLLNSKLKNKEKYLVITFDDGYRDNYYFAFPILKKIKATATIFLTVNYLDSRQNLFFENKEVPYAISENDYLLSRAQIDEMSVYGVEFGSHTLSHPHLTQILDQEAIKEINNSKKILESYLKQDVVSFCYPYGDVNERVVEIVKEAGYKVGVVTTASSRVPKGSFTFRRTGVYLPDSIKKFRKKNSVLFYLIRETSLGQVLLKMIKLWTK